MRTVICLLAGAALVLIGGSAGAQVPCDFVTGGGYIVVNNAKANFGVGGSCKAGGDGHTLWGHLEYIDHGTDLNVQWTDITGYFFCADPLCGSFVDPPGQPTGTRLICGTATTNQTSGEVTWAVKVTDNNEPGKGSDTFMIQVVGPSFSYTSGDHILAGGNIQLHKPNNSGDFGTPSSTTCPAFVPPPSPCGTAVCVDDQTCNPATQTCECPDGRDFNTVTMSCCPAGATFDPGSGTCLTACSGDTDCGINGSCNTSTMTCCPPDTAFDPTATPPRCCPGGFCGD